MTCSILQPQNNSPQPSPHARDTKRKLKDLLQGIDDAAYQRGLFLRYDGFTSIGLSIIEFWNKPSGSKREERSRQAYLAQGFVG